jgi:hypothetical protein
MDGIIKNEKYQRVDNEGFIYQQEQIEAFSLAVVIDVQADEFVVRSGREEHYAMIAASCLLSPSIGDLVLIMKAKNMSWILSLLIRLKPEEAVRIAGQHDSVSFEAKEISFLAKQSMMFAAKDLSFQADNIRQDSSINISNTSEMKLDVARNLVSKISNHMSLDAESISLNAASLLRLDSNQIHMS